MQLLRGGLGRLYRPFVFDTVRPNVRLTLRPYGSSSFYDTSVERYSKLYVAVQYLKVQRQHTNS